MKINRTFTYKAVSEALEGKKAAGSSSYIFKTKGVIVTGNAVVRDGNIITAYGPSAVKEFSEVIVYALSE